VPGFPCGKDSWVRTETECAERRREGRGREGSRPFFRRPWGARGALVVVVVVAEGLDGGEAMVAMPTDMMMMVIEFLVRFQASPL